VVADVKARFERVLRLTLVVIGMDGEEGEIPVDLADAVQKIWGLRNGLRDVVEADEGL
jgi:hypothetical protein